MTRQGWDRADYRCGRCGHTFTATTETEYADLLSAHNTAHAWLDQFPPGAVAALRQSATAPAALFAAVIMGARISTDPAVRDKAPALLRAVTLNIPTPDPEAKP